MCSVIAEKSEHIKDSRKQVRNNNLDLLKIVACIAVVGLHTIQKESIVGSTIYYLCGFAIPVFFMASGYMLVCKSQATLKYVFRKIIAILRVVVLWNIILFVVECIGNISLGFDVNILDLPIEVVRNLQQKGDLWHFWYLFSLLILYVLLPLIIEAKKRGLLVKVWLTLVGISLFLQVYSCVLGIAVQENYVQTFRLWSWLQYFILGGLLNEYNVFSGKFKNISFPLHGILLFVCTIIVLVYQNFASRFIIHNLYAEYFYDSIFDILWIALLFTFVMRINLNSKIESIIKKLASLTMGIYIVHIIIIDKLIPITTKPYNMLFASVESRVLLSFITFFQVLFLSVLVSWLISKTSVAKYLTNL